MLRHPIAAATIAILCAGCAATSPTVAAPAATPVRWTPAEISTAMYESSPSFSPDGAELFLFRADRQFDN